MANALDGLEGRLFARPDGGRVTGRGHVGEEGDKGDKKEAQNADSEAHENGASEPHSAVIVARAKGGLVHAVRNGLSYGMKSRRLVVSGGLLFAVSFTVLVGCERISGPIPPTNARLELSLFYVPKGTTFIVQADNLSEVPVTDFVLKAKLGYVDILKFGPEATGLTSSVPVPVNPWTPIPVPPESKALFTLPLKGIPFPPRADSPHKKIFCEISWTYRTSAGPHEGSKAMSLDALSPWAGS